MNTEFAAKAESDDLLFDDPAAGTAIAITAAPAYTPTMANVTCSLAAFLVVLADRAPCRKALSTEPAPGSPRPTGRKAVARLACADGRASSGELGPGSGPPA